MVPVVSCTDSNAFGKTGRGGGVSKEPILKQGKKMRKGGEGEEIPDPEKSKPSTKKKRGGKNR